VNDWDLRWVAGAVGGILGAVAGQAIERKITEDVEATISIFRIVRTRMTISDGDPQST